MQGKPSPRISLKVAPRPVHGGQGKALPQVVQLRLEPLPLRDHLLFLTPKLRHAVRELFCSQAEAVVLRLQPPALCL